MSSDLASRTALDEERLVVVVDYPGRRPEAHLTELPLERAGFRVCDLLRHPLPSAAPLAAYARSLIAREAACADAVAVLGYCAAAPLAAEVASQLSSAGGSPLPVVFLDPSRCNAHHIVAAYASVLQQIDGSTDRVLGLTASRLHEQLGDPVALGATLAADVEDRVRSVLSAGGFDERECDAAVDATAVVYAGWLNFLLAVHNRGEAAHEGPVFNLISAAHPADAAWLGVRASDTRRLPCTRAELARRSETFDLIVEFLNTTTRSRAMS